MFLYLQHDPKNDSTCLYPRPYERFLRGHVRTLCIARCLFMGQQGRQVAGCWRTIWVG
jgi:hypothetical protein